MPGLANELIMIIEVYENKKKIFSEEFETTSFFFLPLVELGDKYGITNDLLEYHENTKEALILRKNRRLSKEELNKHMGGSKKWPKRKSQAFKIP